MQHQVVEQGLLLCPVRSELPTLIGMSHSDGEADFRRAHRRRRDAHPARDERAQHGEEATGRARDRTRVHTRLVDGGEAVEQVSTRHTHVFEPDASVVHTIEALLEASVLDANAGQYVAGSVSDRHEQRMNALIHAPHDQPSENGRHLPVARRVSYPILGGGVRRRGDDDLIAARFVRRCRLEVAHVGAVSGLGHRVASGQIESADRAEVGTVMPLGAELQYAAPEETELNSELHQDAQVSEREALEDGEGGAGVVSTAVGGGEGGRAQSALREEAHGVQHALTIFVCVETQWDEHG